MTGSSPLPQGADPKAIGRQLLQRAHNRDGLAEIWIGVWFLLLSGLLLAVHSLPRESFGFRVAVLASALLLPILGVGSNWVLRWMRRRFLIERWGFVEYKLMDRKWTGVGILLAALMALIIFGVVPRLSQPDPWLLAGTGLYSGVILVLIGWTGRLPRFVIGGILWAIAGAVVALSGVSLDVGFIILFGFQGLLTLISGCVVFRRFMRQPVEPGD